MKESDSENQRAFCSLAEDVCQEKPGKEETFPAPLTREELEKFGEELGKELEDL